MLILFTLAAIQLQIYLILVANFDSMLYIIPYNFMIFFFFGFICFYLMCLCFLQTAVSMRRFILKMDHLLYSSCGKLLWVFKVGICQSAEAVLEKNVVCQ